MKGTTSFKSSYIIREDYIMWHYNQLIIRRIEDLSDHATLFGFCYKITNLKTGRIYIGKKQFYTKRRKKLCKKERYADKRKKQYKIEVKESDWINYWGSNKELMDDIKQFGFSDFKREILSLAWSKKYLGYLEIKYQFHYDVLTGKTYNKNILGRFFSRDIEIEDYNRYLGQ